MDPNLTGVSNRFMDPKSEASSHVIIGYDGHRRIFAEPNQVTFHAGASF
jgi:N-acetyl-anhydromuramyl-L-alanine amidase AmpD